MTSLDCARAQSWMTTAEAGHLAEADACRLEDHLQGCVACRSARARLAALAGVLREAPGDERRAASLDRAVERALEGRVPRTAERPAPRVVGRALAAVAVLAGAFAMGWWWVGGGDEAPAPREQRATVVASGTVVGASGRAITPGKAVPLFEELQARTGATLRLGDVTARLDTGSRVAVRDDALVLRAGRVDVTVRPGVPFAVRADRFIVHRAGTPSPAQATARGTHFVVTSAYVEVTEGRVEVTTLQGTSLASLGPGGRWSLPVATATADAPIAAPPSPPTEPAAPHVARTTPSAKAPRAEAAGAEPTPTIADVRAALRARETARARALLDQLAGRPGISRGEVDMLHADSFRLERRFADALREYHAVAARYRGSATGEAALFTAAQLELDRLGRPGDARRTLEEYRRRHPNGRFQAEVERMLARLGGPREER